MTSVTKEMLSHLRISQQFFSADTELSRVLMADDERDWNTAFLDIGQRAGL